MELNRDTINKIEEMSNIGNKVISVTDPLDGSVKTFSLDKLYEVKPERKKLKSMACSSLTGFEDYIKHMLKGNTVLPIIIKVNDDGVSAETGLIDCCDRDVVAYASPNRIRNDYGYYRSVEETIISLQTKFIRTDVVESILGILKCMVVDNTVCVEDDGVSQKVTVANGAGLKSEIPLNPIIRLKPYTTFYELEQPERLFLLRVNKSGEIALFEADGDSYKQDIIITTRNYLKYSFTQEINDGVIVIA